MNFSKVITLISILFAAGFAHAETTSEMGLWERFCLHDKIGDACGRAVNSLTDKMMAEDGELSVNYLSRLQAVAELGCQLNDKTSCGAVADDSAEQPLNTELLVQQDSN